MNEYDEAIKNALPNMSVLSVYEYPSCYVYNVIPTSKQHDFKDDSILSRPLDSSYKVDKKTKIVSVFAPFEMGKEEYEKGKKIR